MYTYAIYIVLLKPLIVYGPYLYMCDYSYNIIGDEEEKDYMYKMAILGHVEAFSPESDSITMYLERIDLFIIANKV